MKSIFITILILLFSKPSILITIKFFFGLVFLQRAIGDFKYMGFFKKIKHSNFSRLDSMVSSPLCLLIGIVMLLTILIS